MPNLPFTAILAAGTTATTTAAKKSHGSSSYFLIIIVLFVGVYFLVLRPRQQKARAARSGVANTLSVGDEVVTIGGILGVVSDIDGDAIVVEVAPGTNMTFLRRAVNLRTPATGGAPANPVATPDDSDADYETYDDEDDGWEDEEAAGDLSVDHPAGSGQGDAAHGEVTDDDGDGQGNDRGGRGEGRRR